MSHVTRRKHVLKEMLDDDYELPTEQQQIVRVVSSRGNNLLQVETPQLDVTDFLVSVPTKFRRNMWVKRGDYLLVDTIKEGDKVKGEINKILSPQHVKEYTKAGVWPEEFTKKREPEVCLDMSDDENADKFVVRNRNRPVQYDVEEDDEEETSSEDED